MATQVYHDRNSSTPHLLNHTQSWNLRNITNSHNQFYFRKYEINVTSANGVRPVEYLSVKCNAISEYSVARTSLFMMGILHASHSSACIVRLSMRLPAGHAASQPRSPSLDPPSRPCGPMCALAACPGVCQFGASA